MTNFTQKDAKSIRKKLQTIVDDAMATDDCDHNCRECALLSSIRAGKGTQCTLNILELCLKGELG
jgi:hypothetical protein